MQAVERYLSTAAERQRVARAQLNAAKVRWKLSHFKPLAFAVLLADALRADGATGRGPGAEDCRSAVRGRHGAALNGDGPRLGDFKYRACAVFVGLGWRGGHIDLVDLR